jgi:hypothetical protein
MGDATAQNESRASESIFAVRRPIAHGPPPPYEHSKFCHHGAEFFDRFYFMKESSRQFRNCAVDIGSRGGTRRKLVVFVSQAL